MGKQVEDLTKLYDGDNYGYADSTVLRWRSQVAEQRRILFTRRKKTVNMPSPERAQWTPGRIRRYFDDNFDHVHTVKLPHRHISKDSDF